MPVIFDIVIYGSNFSGIFAAKAARAKGNYKVAVIEPTNWRGGLVTGGLCLTDYGDVQNWWGYWQQINTTLASYYGGDGADIGYAWRFEPKLMIEALNAFIGSDANITWVYNSPIESVTKADGKAVSITCGGVEYSATVFLDCSYEGDLMRLAGVTSSYGRESAFMFGEALGGIAEASAVTRAWPGVDGKGNRYSNTQPFSLGVDGEADTKIQGANFRMIWSTKADRLPWQAPPNYRREDFLDVLHEVTARGLTTIFGDDWYINRPLNDVDGGYPRPSADGKYGINQFDRYGLSWEWPTATWARRREIIAAIYYRMAGTLYFLANDASLAGTPIQTMANSWGLCSDEYQAVGSYYGQPGWPPMLYIRESRRMIGQYVETQSDYDNRGSIPDSVSVARYFIDSHTVQQTGTEAGQTIKEGSKGGGGYKWTPVSMRALKPWKGQCDNLLVPVCMSSSSVIWQPLRMEPLFAMLGQVAGWMAHLSISQGIDVVDVSYSSVKTYLDAEGAII